MKQPGFFDIEERYYALSKCGDPLEKLNECIPWDKFRPIIEKALEKERKTTAGRKPFDPIVMFKTLVLQTMYNLSDYQTEYQLRDRFTFIRFLGLGIHDTIPDEKTIWLFRENLTNAGVIKKLFDKFNRYLEENGYEARKGQIIDASIVEVPIQRNSREDNKKLSEGEIPEEWEENPNKMSQKDTEADWTKRKDDSHFGYKNHINVDVAGKFIRGYEVTSASIHDSQVIDDIIDKRNTDTRLYADSAYSSEEIEKKLCIRGLESRINHKGYRNHPLSNTKININRRQSKIRARIEHVFGFQHNSMAGGFIRTIGVIRASTKIGLMNIVYNFRRYSYLCGIC